MLWVIFWVAVSFFAIVGLMEILLFLLEVLALRRISSIQKVSLRVELKGEDENAEYILNMLSLMQKEKQERLLTQHTLRM